MSGQKHQKPRTMVKNYVLDVMDKMFQELRVRKRFIEDVENYISGGALKKISVEDFKELVMMYLKMTELVNRYNDYKKRLTKIIKILWNHFGCERLYQTELREKDGRVSWDTEKLEKFFNELEIDPELFKKQGRSYTQLQRVASTVNKFDAGKLERVTRENE